jgi:hypothetical protein
MQDCRVCGRSFDPFGFQVVVPELGRGFDRIECAESARTHAGPGARIAAASLAPAAELNEAAAVPAAAAATARRSIGPSATTVGLLAAGTAAAIVLWARALGGDPSSFTLGRLTVPPAFGRETVQAESVPAPAPAPTPSTASNPEAAPAPQQAPLVVAGPPSPTTVTVAGRVSPPPSSPATPVSRAEFRSTVAKGKGHPKHGAGHFKVKPNGNHGHGLGKGNGHGKSKGKGEH